MIMPYRLDKSYQQENGRLPHVYTPFVNGRVTIKTENKPARQNGTVRLDGEAYTLSSNNLPGIVPLHLNENLFTAAQEAAQRIDMATLMETALNQLHSYPIDGAKQLQTALASHLTIAEDKLVISHGSSALLRDLFLYLLQKGDTLLMPDPGWSYYKALANLVEAQIDTFPLEDTGDSFVYDVDDIAAKIAATQPKVVLITSPNNPTGSVLPVQDFIWLTRIFPQVNFILDEAYYGFTDAYFAEQEKLLLAVTDQTNVFLVRTFSKFYALANLRLGYVICAVENGRNLQKIAPVFGIPTFSQAIAAQRLTDKRFIMGMSWEYMIVNQYMFTSLSQIPGMMPYKTAANFILVQHDGRWHDIEKHLLAQGFMIKRETINGDNNYLRISYADMATMQRFVSLIQGEIGD